MLAPLEVPESIAHQLQTIAANEQTTVCELLVGMIAEHARSRPSAPATSRRIVLPAVPVEFTGPVASITGKEIDELFARDDLAS